MTNHSRIYEKSCKRILLYEKENRNFIDIFYHQFMGLSEEVRGKISSTNFHHQKIMLRNSLMYMQRYYESGYAGEYLTKLARSHGPKGSNISCEMYDLWLEALLSTLLECDPGYTKEVKTAWSKVLKPGLDFVKSHCS